MKALVLVASGLHLGYIGCYGNEWVQTPTLDRLAAQGIVFDQHYADQPDAAGAQRAWQTGGYGFPSAKAENESPTQEATNLFSLLGEHGIGTYLVSDDKDRSLATTPAGWQHLHLLESAAGKAASSDELLHAMVKALNHLGSCENWLLRIDLGTLLPPWKVPDEFRNRSINGRTDEDEGEPASLSADPASLKLEETEELAFTELQDRYAEAVTYLDTVAGQVLHELEKRRLAEDTLVLLTADGGQMLGEDVTRPGSRLWLHEELIHIPLLLRLPGKVKAGRRVAALTQPVDLLPTLLEAFGVPVPMVHGHSLLPLAGAESDPIREYACAGLRRGDAVEWTLRSSDWSLILSVSPSSPDLAGESELYVKPDDRWEVNNVRQHHLELAEYLERTLRGFVEATRRPGPLHPPELPTLEVEMAAGQQDSTADSTERGTAP